MTNADDQTPHTPSTPRARRLAGLAGIDSRQLNGTGAGGRVRAADVIAAIDSDDPGAPRVSQATRILDATEVVRFATQLEQNCRRGEDPPTCGDMLIKAAATALQIHPQLAADGCHIGTGLLSNNWVAWPVLRDADGLSLRRIAKLHRDLQDAARGGRLAPTVEQPPPAVLVIDAAIWNLDSLSPWIPSWASVLISIGRVTQVSSGAEPSADEDEGQGESEARRPSHQAQLELVINTDRVAAPTAIRYFQEVAELLQSPHWMVTA